jgi:hypothetical protein
MRKIKLLGLLAVTLALFSSGCCCRDRCHVRRPFWRMRERCCQPACDPCCTPCCPPVSCCASPGEVPFVPPGPPLAQPPLAHP